MNSNKPLIIGITGGSASGKTLFLEALFARFNQDEITLISQDNYYHPIELQTKDPNGIENFDLPSSINHLKFAEDIQRLIAGETIHLKEYTFNNKGAIPKELTIFPSKILVVEGIFVFHFKEISQLIDLKIFIDATDEIKLQRRIQRDAKERGYDLNDVLYRWENHVRPTYLEFIRPHKMHADLIIPNNQDFQKGLDVLVSYLKK